MASSPLLAWVRPSLGPCYFHLKYSTNLPSAVSTSYQLFFTPVHLKTADGFFFLKFGSAHVTLLFPSCLRINCKCFTLAFRPSMICYHPILLPYASPRLQPCGGSCCSPGTVHNFLPDDTSSFNAFAPPPPL